MNSNFQYKQKMKHLFSIFLILFCSTTTNAQALFEKYYGISGRNNAASFFQILPDGGFILSGSSDGEGYLIRTNSNGDTLWTRLYPDATADCIKVQLNGDFFLAGSYGISPPPTAVLTHCDSSGNLIYTTSQSSSPFSRYGIATEVLDYQHVGFLDNDFYPFQEFLRLHCYDSIWNHSWEYQIGKVSDCSNSSLRKTNDGFVVACGSFDTPYPHLRVCRIDSTGNSIWNKDFNYDSVAQTGQSAWSMCATADSGFMVLGYRTYGTPTLHYNILLMKLNSAGDSLWSKEYYFQNSNSFRSIQLLADGGFIVCGTVSYPPSGSFFDYRVVLLRTDANGDSLWTKEFPGLGLSNASHVDVTPTGDIVTLSTSTDQNNGETFFYLLKTDSTGSLIATNQETDFQSAEIYPNPANETLTIDIPKKNKEVKIKISDLAGNLILEFVSTENKIVIPTASFSDGNYFLQIFSDEKSFKAKRFIVLH